MSSNKDNHLLYIFILLVLFIFNSNSFVFCCYSKVQHNICVSHSIDNKSNEQTTLCNTNKPKNVLTMTKEEQKKFLDSFDVIITDLDGVLWMVSNVLPGVGDVINSFKNIGKKVTYVSNNSLRPASDLKTKFKELNVDIDVSDIFHPARTTTDYLRKIKFDGLIYLIGSSPFKQELINAGFSVIDGPNEILKESFEEMTNHIFKKDPVRAVIMDGDINISGAKMIKAQMYLRNPECIFIIGATDKLLPVHQTISVIGPGYFAEIVEKVSGKTPIVLGKPGKDLCGVIEDQLNIKDSKRVLMIGDTLDQDVIFGKLCNFQTLVVFTGDAKLDDFKKTENSERLPNYYANSLAEMKILFNE